MPWYDYQCPRCGVFEARGGIDADAHECVCGEQSPRSPFHGRLAIQTGTVPPSQIPNAEERRDVIARNFRREWGGADRSIEMIRKNMIEDGQGNKMLDLNGMNQD